MSIQRHAASFKEGTTRPLKAFQKMLGLMVAASPVLQLGLLQMRPIQFWLKQRVPSAAWCHGRHCLTVTRACVSALAPWRDNFWLKRGVTLDTAHRRKIVTTDASNKSWRALCEGKPTFGLYSEEESGLHINCLEMLAVCQVCQFFLPDIWRHHVLVRSDSRFVVSYINPQGGLIDNSHCPRARKPWPKKWPSLPLYAFPSVGLLPQVLRRVRERWHKLILIAPLWRNQPWSELFQLLKAAPWPIPLRRDLLSQANGTIWHPRPELWALHVWPLDGRSIHQADEKHKIVAGPH